MSGNAGGIDGLEGLIEEQNLGRVNHRRGECHAFAHPGGVLRQGLGRVRKLERIQKLGDPPARRRFIEPEHPGDKAEKLVGVQRLEQTECFRHDADAAFDGGAVGIEALAQDLDLSAGGVEQAGPCTQPMVVLLPEPFGHRKPNIAPVRTLSERFSTATAGPYFLTTLVRRIASMVFFQLGHRPFLRPQASIRLTPGCQRWGLRLFRVAQ